MVILDTFIVYVVFKELPSPTLITSILLVFCQALALYKILAS